jgi:Calcium binding
MRHPAEPAARGRYSRAVDSMTRAQLDALVEEATVDCYNEDEQVTGLYTMIEDNLAVPFQTTVLGVKVTVESIDLTDRSHIVATCRRGTFRQTIPVLDLPLPMPAPDGAQWIEAYRHWAR